MRESIFIQITLNRIAKNVAAENGIGAGAHVKENDGKQRCASGAHFPIFNSFDFVILFIFVINAMIDDGFVFAFNQ